MIQSYETAKYDIVWVCDSNVYVDRGCMGRSIDKMMQPGVGLVHHLPFGVRPKTLGSELELMFLDTVHAKMYLFINWTGLASCVVGKSNLYRRSDLDKVGGMAAFGKYMAEDNLVATAIFNMGYKHAMTSDLAYQSLGSMTPSDYFLRRARWTRIRKYTVTAATIVEPFIEMIGCGLVASYGFNLLWQIHFLNFLAFHVVAWFLVDLTVYQALSGQTMDNLQGFLMAWSLRELAALPLFAYAVAGSTVDWRDQTFLLLRDGTVKPLVAPSPAKVTPSSSSASSSPSSSSSSSRSSSSASISATGSIPSSPTTTAAATLSTPPSPSVAAFWSKANNVMPPSTQATVRKFLRHPTVISIVRSTLAIIHFVVDILMKSQRNGNDYEAQVTMDPTVDSELLLDEQSDDGHVVKNSGVDPIVMLKKVPLAKKLKNRKYHHANTRSSSYSYDGDDSSAAESDAIVETRRQTIDRRASGLQHSHSGSEEETRTKVVDHDLWTLDADQIQPGDRTIFYSTVKSETEAEHGRRSTEEDALSKAMEPYLSDSLSRRGRTRHEIPSASQFLSV
ncbi:hypothetical protein BGZ94_009823 [Podila epigama]|nr:hypothetical protein BGZ94_009823 [Podila epigama]